MKKGMFKTQRLICEAMKTLLKEEEYNEISVQDIVNKAKVSRSSFYNHFESKRDVVILMINELAENIAAVEEFRNGDDFDKAAIRDIRTRVIDYCADHREDILIIFRAGFAPDYSRIVRTKILEVRRMFSYEFEDEDGNKTVLSDGILYDMKTWSDVNDTVSALELYYEKYSDMPSKEYEEMIQKAGHMSMTGQFFKK